MPTMYTLSINPNNATAFYVNNVTPSDFLPKKYVKGTILYLLAYKDASPASSWTGGCDNGAGGQGDGSSCVVTMNSDKSMAPVFTTAYTLTVTRNNAGYISAGDSFVYPGIGSYASGTAVTLTATFALGYPHVNWTGCTSVSGVSNQICTVLVNSNKTVNATFSRF